uniref:Fatty acid desaturase domain-containing protein n=1 Tax=Kalanchoe fedtschenkoi TaxID=63787 RepID=A0A7N0RF80_KALFE
MFTFVKVNLVTGFISSSDWYTMSMGRPRGRFGRVNGSVEGFWFSHVRWVFDRHHLTEKCGEANNVSDLRKQIFYRFVEKTYYFHALAQAPVLYLAGGFPFVVWGGAVRIVAYLHVTFLVNSVCYLWGGRAWDTGDLSTNNWWMAVVNFGEGWHNNHHAFEWSARHGLEWWQVDATWGVIRLLEAVGLAKDIKLPSEAHKKKMAL